MVAVVKRLTRATVTRICEGSIPSSHPKTYRNLLVVNRLFSIKKVSPCVGTQFGTHGETFLFYQVNKIWCIIFLAD